MPASKPEKNGHRPISIDDFRNHGREVTVTWLDAEYRVVYRPGVMDAEHYRQLRDEDKDLPVSEWNVKWTTRVLVAIPSFCEPDGSPLQITESNMRLLPTEFLNRIIDTIGQDVRPKATTGS